jgi:hypothetical protein
LNTAGLKDAVNLRIWNSSLSVEFTHAYTRYDAC